MGITSLVRYGSATTKSFHSYNQHWLGNCFWKTLTPSADAHLIRTKQSTLQPTDAEGLEIVPRINTRREYATMNTRNTHIDGVGTATVQVFRPHGRLCIIAELHRIVVVNGKHERWLLTVEIIPNNVLNVGYQANGQKTLIEGCAIPPSKLART